MSVANIVSLSGGKDSTATALLAIEREAEGVRFVFADTGHEHPLTYAYIDYLDGELRARAGVGVTRVRGDFATRIANKRAYITEHWPAEGVPAERVERALELLQPTGIPFLDLCLWKGRFPSPRRRFCTEQLKHLPITEEVMVPATRTHERVLSWQGVRRDESRARADLAETEPDPLGWTIYRPLLDWSADDVFAMHRRHGLRWNPLYELGMGRVGCMPCVMARKGEIREIAARFPEEVERVAEWERLVSAVAKRGCSTFVDARITAQYLGTGLDDIRIETHGIHTYVQWAKTARGGRQADLFADDVPQCSSVYGLCE